MKSLTPKRRLVLDVIESSAHPLSSQEIYLLKEGSLNLATVYRTLTYLEKNNLIEAFSLFSESVGTVRYYFRRNHPHLHFFFCKSCHSFTPYHDCTFSQQAREEIEKKYEHQIDSHVLYFTGICRECREG
ncbi:MAG: transcriptional repressor [Deltaproteobacteria bacterium]|nr:transcriptional repressor [Deltaproteobacteria bacterium]MBW2659157.1 transcriptional repressor [Deltaproteobacteria bacterium]